MLDRVREDSRLRKEVGRGAEEESVVATGLGRLQRLIVVSGVHMS